VAEPATRQVPAQAMAELVAIVGADSVIRTPLRLLTYESDANGVFHSLPAAVVLPHDIDETRRVVEVLARHGVPFLPRGAGTGLAGGAVALGNEVVVDTVRLTRLDAPDLDSAAIWAEVGVTNVSVSVAVAGDGMFYAPDPSSQAASTIGGNVANNSGGSHCLKYGVTTNHILAVDAILPDGTALRMGGDAPDLPGYDLRGLFVGSEGTMGVATRALLRLTPTPAEVRTVLATFDSVRAASQTVSAVIAAGMLPAAMEVMDRMAIDGVEKGPYPVGFGPEVGATLLFEVDGLPVSVEAKAQRIEAICKQMGVQAVRIAQSAEERALWWANRKTAFGAMGNLGRNFYVQDGVIPRTRLPDVIDRVGEIGAEFGLRIANVFHAGDGNLHPLILFDAKKPGDTEKAMACGSAILKVCVEAGGSITGEHGVGVEKRADMAVMFGEADLALQDSVRRVFDPRGIANPGKVLPTPDDIRRASAG